MAQTGSNTSTVTTATPYAGEAVSDAMASLELLQTEAFDALGMAQNAVGDATETAGPVINGVATTATDAAADAVVEASALVAAAQDMVGDAVVMVEDQVAWLEQQVGDVDPNDPLLTETVTFLAAVVLPLAGPNATTHIADQIYAVSANADVPPTLANIAAAAMLTARANGVDFVQETYSNADGEFRDLTDDLLLNQLESLTSSQINAINDVVDGGLLLVGPGNGASNKEKQICGRNPYDCWRARNADTDAEARAQERFVGQKLHNTPADAFRHCLFSAFMTERANRDFAKEMGDAHEDAGDDKGQPKAERDMDLHNNAVGRDVGVLGEGQSDTWLDNTCNNRRIQRQLVWIEEF